MATFSVDDVPPHLFRDGTRRYMHAAEHKRNLDSSLGPILSRPSQIAASYSCSREVSTQSFAKQSSLLEAKAKDCSPPGNDDDPSLVRREKICLSSPLRSLGYSTDEVLDPPDIRTQKIRALARALKLARHAIAFTGAGISTAAGIPDYRSKLNTVLEVGPGRWELAELAAQGAAGLPRSGLSVSQLDSMARLGLARGGIDRHVAGGSSLESKASVSSSARDAWGSSFRTGARSHSSFLPTFSHFALTKLVETQTLKFVLSQNTDGLHLRSGLHDVSLAELHGNINLEVCHRCREDAPNSSACRESGGRSRPKRYLRVFPVEGALEDQEAAAPDHSHRTKRKCDVCKRPLFDTIVHFGESLPEWEMAVAKEQANSADLCLVLGSSLKVQPARDLPLAVALRRSSREFMNYTCSRKEVVL